MTKRTTLHSLSAAVFALCSSAVFAADPASKPAPPSAEVAQIMLTAERWSSDDVNAVARFVNASQYVFISDDQGPVFYESGNPLLRLGAGYGETLQVGEASDEGVYWNFSKDSAFVRIGDGPGVVELLPRSLIVIGGALKDENLARPIPGAVIGAGGGETIFVNETVSITCGPGFYACCKRNSGGSSRTAECLPNSAAVMPLCTSGGPGSVSCSTSDN